MTAKEFFGLEIRTAGVVFIVYSFFNLFHIIVKLVGIPYPAIYSLQFEVVTGIGYFAMGAALILRARFLVWATYGRD